VFHDHRLFAVRASVVSGPMAPEETEKAASVQASMVSGLAAPGETEKAASSLEALASALVDLSRADLARLQAARR
jgi:hypothetical protein